MTIQLENIYNFHVKFTRCTDHKNKSPINPKTWVSFPGTARNSSSSLNVIFISKIVQESQGDTSECRMLKTI